MQEEVIIDLLDVDEIKEVIDSNGYQMLSAQNQAAGLANEDLNEKSAATGVTEKKPVGNEDEGDCAITGVTKHSRIQVSKRRQKVPDSKDYRLISNRCMLNDWLMNNAQNILHDKFPLVEGLEDTVLGPVGMFSVHTGEFVQILHDGQCHWVAVSNIGCKKGEIDYFDSLFSGTIKHHVKKLIASLAHEDGKALRVRVRSVQQQRNGFDCGVFAIAFVTSLLHGEDPTLARYDDSAMRPHLLACLKQKKLTPFPSANDVTRAQVSSSRTVTMKLMCTCRQPWHKDDQKDPQLWCVECDLCGEWYHRTCVPSIPDNVFKDNVFWECEKCEKGKAKE